MNLEEILKERFSLITDCSYPYIGTRGGRNELAELLGELKFNRGVEVGTADGHFAVRLCQANPDLKLTCVDPWTTDVYTNQARQERHYLKAVEKLTPFNVEIMRMTSMEAVGKFEDKSLDFVYIDADHRFNFVMCDIIFWNAKVRTGGIFAGHDYFFVPDIARAVQAYVDCHNIAPWYALKERYAGGRRAGGTFFWVVK